MFYKYLIIFWRKWAALPAALPSTSNKSTSRVVKDLCRVLRTIFLLEFSTQSNGDVKKTSLKGGAATILSLSLTALLSSSAGGKASQDGLIENCSLRHLGASIWEAGMS